MNRTPTSLAYRIARWRLSQRPSKHAAAIFVVLALLFFGFALSDDRLVVLNAMAATGFLFSAYSEWELTGFREVVAETTATPESPPAMTER